MPRDMDEKPVTNPPGNADGGVHEKSAGPGIRAQGTRGRNVYTEVRVNLLKKQVEGDGYDVDASAVADAMLRRIQLLRQGRNALWISGAGRIPPGPESPPVP